MRAVYVPTPVLPGEPARYVARAPAVEDGGTMTFFPAAAITPCTILLTPKHLRLLLRHWAEADRDGQGLLEIGD